MKPTITLIAVLDNNNLIGSNNTLPWHLPADLKHFKQTTLHHTVVMGRKTFDSIGRRPLLHRTNIVVTRNVNYQSDEVIVVNSLEQAIDAATDENEIFIAGGAQIYRDAVSYADKLVITRVHHTFEGDTYFPAIDEQQWKEMHQEYHQPDEKNTYPYSFHTYMRKNTGKA